jgi:hypothetical protein
VVFRVGGDFVPCFESRVDGLGFLRLVVFRVGGDFVPCFESGVDGLGFLPSCLARRMPPGVFGSFGVESPICIDAVRSLIVPSPAFMLLSSLSILSVD